MNVKRNVKDESHLYGLSCQNTCRGAPLRALKLGGHTCVPKHFGAQAQRAAPTELPKSE